MPGGINYSITVPGKVYRVTAEDYEIINGNTVLVKNSYVDLIRNNMIPGFEIEFEPAKPITDPKVTEVWEPEPAIVNPSNKKIKSPSDAIILFDGKNMDNWVHYDGRPAEWNVSKKIMTIKPGSGTIKTTRDFGDIQLHLEWRSPKEPNRKGQDRGNSGVFFQNKYEVQILNSYQNRTYSNGQAASVYKQYPPLVNAMNPPGEWNTYDIIFHAPKFDNNGQQIKSGTLTVIHNGVLVQDHVEIMGTTEYIGRPKTIPHGDGPLVLQDHSNKVSFRNIWVREL